MKKIKRKINKQVHLDMSILQISKILMYEFWYDYIKPKYQNNSKLCCMDTDIFIIHIKTEDFYEDIANDVKKWSDTSNYGVVRPILRGMNKKVMELMKDDWGGNIMIKIAALRPLFNNHILF